MGQAVSQLVEALGSLTGRSRVQFKMVSLEFFIDLILSAGLWRWVRLSLLQEPVAGIFPGGDKGGRFLGLKTHSPSRATCLEI
jgi:hypothetical protein